MSFLSFSPRFGLFPPRLCTFSAASQSRAVFVAGLLSLFLNSFSLSENVRPRDMRPF